MAIQSVKAVVNGEEVTLTLNSSTGKYEATVTAPNISTNSDEVTAGYFPVSVTASDTAGNSTTVDSSDSAFGENLKLYVKEQVKPIITISSPTANEYNVTGSQTISFSISDKSNGQTYGYSGIDRNSIVLSIDGQPVSGLALSEVNGGYCGTYTTTLEDGVHTITVNGTDRDGNAAETASVTFTVDTVKPELTNIQLNGSSGESYETNRASIVVSGVTNDSTSKPVSVSITVNGSDTGDITIGSDGTFSKTVTLEKDGTYTVLITATDTAGNSTSISRTVIYNTTAPKFKSIAISPNPAFAGKTYTISVEVE